MNRNLNKSLFWDVDTSSLDFDIHARFVIERVLARGSVDDWLMLLKLYGKKESEKKLFIFSKLYNLIKEY